ncbi:MAG: hypothetical protein ABIA63_10385 [bacterium]
MLIKVFILFLFALVFAFFLVLAKTLGNINITLEGLEYMLSREFELTKQKEAVRNALYGRDSQGDRKKGDNPLLNIPVKSKEKKD